MTDTETAFRQRIAELEEALRPFAVCAEQYSTLSETHIAYVLVRDLRTAAALIESAGTSVKGGVGELLPCPFCGGPAEIDEIDEGENAGGSCVACTRCFASSNIEFGREENFISNWNRRACPEKPTPHEASDDQVEQVARIIDPGSWSVMDAEKERFLRKYKGENIGYPEDQFRHKESMAKASAILTIVLSEPVGYTNENQLKYVDSGGDRLFYPGDKSGASIALYRTHADRGALRMPAPAVDEGKLREIRERHDYCTHVATKTEWEDEHAWKAHADRAALLEMLDALTKGDRDAE